MKMEIRQAAAAALLLGMVAIAHAQSPGRAAWEEYDKLIGSRTAVTALGPDLLGDSVDLNSGALTFSATDVNIPGNSKLPVAFSRTFSVVNREDYDFNDLPLADWDLDIPRLSGVFATTWHDNRCTSPGAPPARQSGGIWFNSSDYWHGYEASMPGGGQMLRISAAATKPSTGGPYHWMTSGQTFFSCLDSIQNGPGQGYLAIAADGTKYWFQRMAQYVEPQLKEKPPQGGSWVYLSRRKNVLYATRVEDRFGNWVKYTYSNNYNAPIKLENITSNDSRTLTFHYNARGHVDQVSDGEHTWHYQYSYPTAHTGTLTSVTLPDTRQWSISFAQLASAAFRYHRSLDPGDIWRSCFYPGDVEGATSVVGSITHPSGATGQFTASVRRHGRSNVPALCGGYSMPYNDPNDDVAYYPINWDSYSLTKKQISGLGLTTAVWNYSYGSNVSWFNPPSGGGHPVCQAPQGCAAPVCTSDACAGNAVTIVTGPDNRWTRYTFGNSYRYNEGKMLKVEEGTSSTNILKTTTKAYNLAQSGQAFPTPIGTSTQLRGDGFTSEYLRPQRSNVISQQGTNFSSTVDEFDHFARPTELTKASTVAGSPSRAEAITYHDNLSKWVIGQTAIQSTDGIQTTRSVYDANAMPWKTYTFGKAQPDQTLTYHTDGTLATVSDGRDNGSFNTTTMLSDWKRGIPRLIQHPATPDQPAGTTESAVVDNNGWIESVVDKNGYKTCYEYDVMGRLTKITYPNETAPSTCTETSWNATTQSFTPGHPAARGLPAGHWRQVVQTGNNKKVILFDALWRPVVEQAYDAGNVNGTLSEIAKRYDASGRLAFQSYPMRPLTSFTDPDLKGVHTEYDALDRVTAMAQDSEQGLLVTETNYLGGFRRQTRNPRGNVMLEAFQAWDTPTYDAPVRIDAPEGVSTVIGRDVFDKPLKITRSGPKG